MENKNNKTEELFTPATNKMSPLQRKLAELESNTELPASPMEQFQGYGIPALTFESGHILALRRFPASTIGPAYTSVWHRNPRGVWRFYSDVNPVVACSRFFGSRLQASIQTPIELSWSDAENLQVELPEHGLQWDIRLAQTTTDRMATLLLRQVPEARKTNPKLLRQLGRLANYLWKTGECQLSGTAPNGQQYKMFIDGIWTIRQSKAWWHTAHLGSPAPLIKQASLGDFSIPQRGYFVTGKSWFEAYDPVLHDLKMHQFDSMLDASLQARPLALSKEWIRA